MEYTSIYKDDENLGRVQISEEVVAVIAGIAATEVKGVVTLAGNVATELISRIGIKLLSRGIKVNITNSTVALGITINIDASYSIPAVSYQIQEKVVSAVESMTGLKVTEVKVMIEHVTIHHA